MPSSPAIKSFTQAYSWVAACMTTVPQVVTTTPFANLWGPMRQPARSQEWSFPIGRQAQNAVSAGVTEDVYMKF